MKSCYCGGKRKKHQIGSGNCFREIVPKKDEPVQLANGKYFVDGYEISYYTLVHQRLYNYSNGMWTRPKDHSSTNSLPDET